MNLLGSLKNIIFACYMAFPFVFALLTGAFSNLKNPIYLRKAGVLFCLVQFVFGSIIYFVMPKTDFSFLNISFCFDKFSSILIVLIGLLFFIISVISKTFILKSHKAFWITLFLILGLTNTIILSDNILISFLNLIWIFFLGYFLNIAYAHSKDYRKDINSQLKLDVGIIGAAIALIMFDFLRFFVLNDVEFSFSNIPDYLYHINETSAVIGFFGFLVLILKMFNLIPLTCRNISNSPKINPLVVYMNTIVQYTLACFLFYKTSVVFSDFYLNYKVFIICYLLFNFIYYLTLSLRLDSVYKFLNSIVVVYFLINLFNVYPFNANAFGAYIYSSIAILISFSLFYLVYAIISDKFKTDAFSEFKRISNKSYLIIFFIIFSVLNFAGTPLLSIFEARLSGLGALFSMQADNIILTIVPYAVMLGMFIANCIVFKVFYMTLIAPVNVQKADIKLSRHQITALGILSFLIIIIGLFSSGIINDLILGIN